MGMNFAAGNNGPHTSARMVPKGLLWPFILITGCFAWWGLSNNMSETLLAAFKKIMSMSDFQTSWTQIAVFGSYFCLALPAAIFIKRFTYKAGVLLGLGIFSAGAMLFYPASITMNYFHFLLAMFIMAGGQAILETSANPYIIALGPEETATRRLNLAQSFNPCGSILGVLLSKYFILSKLHDANQEQRAAMAPEVLKKIQSQELSALMGPYVALAILLLVVWFLIAVTRMPRASDAGSDLNLLSTFGRLIKIRHYVWGVIAQFFYVGAQVGIWSFTIRYVMHELNLNEAEAANYYLAGIVLFTASRFICTGLMKFMTPGNLLTLLAMLAIGFTLVVIYAGGKIGVYSLVGISGCMSLMFPTIFGLAVRGLGDDTKIGGSGLIMAILGGAVLTGVQGQVSDMTKNISLAFYVPLACFAVIVFYGLFECKKDLPAAAAK